MCTVSGTTLTLLAAGECTVDATQEGNGVYAPAAPVSRTFDVDPKTLGVTGVTAASRPYDGTDDATLGFGSAVLVGVESGDDVTLVTAGATGTFPGAGVGAGQTVTVSGLTLGGDDAASYELGTVTTTASITKRNLTVTADDQAIDYGDPDPAFTFTYGAFVNGEGPGVIDTPPTCDVAAPARDVSGSPYTIDCSGGSDANYDLQYTSGELVVSKASQTVSFTTTAPTDAETGGPAYDVAATATSGLTVDITVDAASAGVCAIDAGEVTFTGVGTCTLDADQGGNANWLAASTVSQSFTVAPTVATAPDDRLRPARRCRVRRRAADPGGNRVERPHRRVRVRDARRVLGQRHGPHAARPRRVHGRGDPARQRDLRRGARPWTARSPSTPRRSA